MLAGLEPNFELECSLAPDDAPRLVRLLARGRKGDRTAAVVLTWYDNAGGELAEAGLALVERQQGRARRWRLERLTPDPGATWPCGTPAPVVAEAADRLGLGVELPEPLVPVARLQGRLRTLPEGVDAAAPGVTLLTGTLLTGTLLTGTLLSLRGEQAVCRVTLSGEARAVTGLALQLAGELRLSAAPLALAAEAFAAAGRAAPAGPLGAPDLPPGLSVGDAFAFVCAHLGRVIQHYAPLAAAGADTEPVHQMRVAVRRLRSALALFRRAIACPELEAAKLWLRALGRALGPARDWDVFATGTGAAVAAAFSDDPAVRRLVAAAGRRRHACYADLRRELDGAEFRRLGITLAALAGTRPWLRAEHSDADAAARQAEALDVSLHEYAARALTRRLRQVVANGEDIAKLPDRTLHRIRLRAKRLRYGTEIFAPLYSRRDARRFVRRLSSLQEWLGRLNDGSVAAALIAELGHDRGFAAGVVRGYVAACAGDARAEIERSWRKFRRTQPFW